MAYSLLGSTTLGSNNTTIEVTGLEQKDNLFVICYFMETGGNSINPNLTFNGDNAGGNSNYADRRNFNFGTDSGAVNFDYMEDLWNSDPFPVELRIYIQNIAAMEKNAMASSCTANTAGSSNAPNAAILMGKWINKIDPIDTITFVSNHDFAADSECAVYGSD